MVYWDRQCIEVEAQTTYEAQEKAKKVYQKNCRRKVKSEHITTLLIEKENGQTIVHSTTEFG
jgi:hypothetical protein